MERETGNDIGATARGALEAHTRETEGDDIERQLMEKAMRGELPFEPSYDRILVQEDPPPSHIGDGVLILPEEYREKTCRGRVVAAGADARDKLGLNGHLIGDRILYAKYAGVQFPWRGKKVHFMKTQDILGNYDLAERFDLGLCEYQCGPAPDGEKNHFIAWLGDGEAKWAAIVADRAKTHGKAA